MLNGHIEEKYDKAGKIKAYKAVLETGSGKKRKRRTKTFSISERLSKKEAKEKAELWLAKKKVEKAEGKYIEKDMLTVEKFMLDWIENEKKPHIATTTYDNYYNRINTYIIPNIGHIPIQKLEAYHISQFFADLRRNGRIKGRGGLSENTLKKIYVLLNSAMKKAVQWRLINYNPVQAIESPQPEDYEALAMSAEEVRQLLEAAKDDIFMYTYILFAVLTGMRKSEMLGLKWDCINLGKKSVRVKQRLVISQHTEEKTKHEDKTKRASSKRTIIIPDNLVFQLKKYKNYQEEIIETFEEDDRSEDDYVFCRPDGFPYYPTTYNDKFNNLIKKADLNPKYNIHTLRHTFGTLNLKNKIDPKIIQEMMGHGNISTTMNIYSHVDEEMQEEAARKLEKVIIGEKKNENESLGTRPALVGSDE